MLEKYYPYEYAQSVFDIDYVKLYTLGYRAILFDIDNTLVHHGEDATPEIEALFREIHSIGLKTLLLSNNDDARVKRFIRNIDTPYLCDADKPNPEAYRKAAELLGVGKKEVIVTAGNAGAIDVTYNGQHVGKLGKEGIVVEKKFSNGKVEDVK